MIADNYIKNFKVNVKDSEFDDVKQIIGNKLKDKEMYCITNVPLTDGSYIQEGASHTVLGMEYNNLQYGSQLSLGFNGIKFRTKSKGVWGDWEPATGIVGSGRNANGSYIKYSDGTMRCYGVKTISEVDFSSQTGSLCYSPRQTITFPQQFAENPSTSVSTRTSNMAWAASIASSKNECTFYIMHNANVTRDVLVSWQAEGRWK